MSLVGTRMYTMEIYRWVQVHSQAPPIFHYLFGEIEPESEAIQVISYTCILILVFCRLCVERCLLSCVIPVLMKEEEKVERLVHVYTSLDENATR